LRHLTIGKVSSIAMKCDSQQQR